MSGSDNLRSPMGDGIWLLEVGPYPRVIVSGDGRDESSPRHDRFLARLAEARDIASSLAIGDGDSGVAVTVEADGTLEDPG